MPNKKPPRWPRDSRAMGEGGRHRSFTGSNVNRQPDKSGGGRGQRLGKIPVIVTFLCTQSKPFDFVQQLSELFMFSSRNNRDNCSTMRWIPHRAFYLLLWSIRALVGIRPRGLCRVFGGHKAAKFAAACGARCVSQFGDSDACGFRHHISC